MIIIILSLKHQFIGILRGAGKDDFIDFTIHIVETSLALMRKKTQEEGSSAVTQHVFIFDLEGFSLAVQYNDILKRHLILDLIGRHQHRHIGYFTQTDINLRKCVSSLNCL